MLNRRNKQSFTRNRQIYYFKNKKVVNTYLYLNFLMNTYSLNLYN
jgi:hypothetical protein